jgi:peroxiredoxin Q/BCP
MKKIITSLFLALIAFNSYAAAIEGQLATDFTLKTDAGVDFNLSSRKGKWTVLYFYPKSDTPGCTKQACAFRDSIKQIRDLGAEVIGVSVNSVDDQKRFKEKHHLNFPLLADEKGTVAELYGAKMPVMPMAKRWSFVIDPSLTIRFIEKDVDPVKDAEKMAEKIRELKKS